MPAFIYMATNRQNGKRYIGKTKNPITTRFKGHFGGAKRGATTIFAAAIRKYGEDAFDISILEEASEEHLSAREVFYIAKLKPEYNMTAGGEGSSIPKGTTIIVNNGSIHKRIKKGDTIPEGFVRGMSDQVKAKASEFHKGLRHSEGTREKLRSLSTGKKASAETKAKMSKSRTGKKSSTESIAKRLASRKYGPMSQETKDKLREANTGKKASAETKAKMSSSLLAVYQKKAKLEQSVQSRFRGPQDSA